MVPEVEAEPAAVVAPTEEAFDEERKKENRAANRDRLKQSRNAKRMRWLLPASVACLAVMILLGLFFAQKPPPAPAPPTTSLLDNSVDRRPKLLRKAPDADSGSLVLDVTGVRRPPELVGMWTLQEIGGGTLDLRADGNVILKAPMIDDKMLEVSALWFITKTEGQEYALEFGAEPHRTSNNRATVRLQSDGTLRFIRFMSGNNWNFEPRIFKKN